MRVLTIISGILLVLTGVFCFANPGETFLSLAFVLGLIMVLNSIIQGIAYWWGRSGQNDNNGWIMTEAIITLILGVLVLSNQIAADVAIPMVFGLWVMFSGALRVVTATMIDRANKKLNFAWTLITGILCILGGIYAFLNPIIVGLAIAILLGILFMLQGISTLELGIHMPHEKKVKPKKEKRQRRRKGGTVPEVTTNTIEVEIPAEALEPQEPGPEMQEEPEAPAPSVPAEAGSAPAAPLEAEGHLASEDEAVSVEPEDLAPAAQKEADEPPAKAVQSLDEDQIAAAIRRAEEAQIAAALKKVESIKKGTAKPGSIESETREEKPDFSDFFQNLKNKE